MSTPKIDSTPTAETVGNLHAADFYAWTQAQAGLLRRRAWGQLDLPNLIEESNPWASSSAKRFATDSAYWLGTY